MSEDIVSVEPHTTVAQALSAMRKHGIHELPVLNKKELMGWLSYDNILRRGRLPNDAKIDIVMEMPPRVEENADPVRAAELMIKLRARAVPVVDRTGRLVGVLSRTDLLRAAAAQEAVASRTIDQTMTRELEVVGEDATVDRVEHRLKTLSISQLLVVDPNGRLVGAIGREDIAETRQREDPKERRTARDGAPASGPGRRKDRKIEVGSLARAAPTLAPTKTLGDAIKLMQKRRSWFVVAVEDGRPVGVVSRADILARLAAQQPEEGVMVQISGLNSRVDQAVYDQIYTKAQSTLSKVADEEDLEFLGLHFKQYKAKGDAAKWSLTAHLSTQKRFYVAKADAWDILAATDEAFDVLKDRVRHSKEMRLENRKGGPRRAAAFYRST